MPSPESAEALRPGGLHRHALEREVQDPREGGAHLVASRGDRGTFAQDRDVARSGRVPGVGDQRDDTPQELEPADPFERRIRVGEMLPDVAERRRPEQRVGDRVTDRVAVGMPDQAGLAVEPDAAEPERT